MTTISHSVIPASVGRKPLDAKSDTKTTTVRLTMATLDRIEAVAGDRSTADFIRTAVDAELDRREAAAAQEKRKEGRRE